MLGFLTPARRRGVEILDDPSTASDVRDRSMRDVTRANALFGGTRSVVRALATTLNRLPRRATVLDVGTGLGDIPAEVRRRCDRGGIDSWRIGLDITPTLLRAARGLMDAVVCGDAVRLPIRDASVDLVTCSQLLHHFVEDDARHVIAELHRVSRGTVIVSDLRRSWVAAAGFWIASILLRFHPVTRHDGVTSVLRGFTRHELEKLIYDSTGIRPRIRGGAFWRLSATWVAGVHRVSD